MCKLCCTYSTNTWAIEKVICRGCFRKLEDKYDDLIDEGELSESTTLDEYIQAQIIAEKLSR